MPTSYNADLSAIGASAIEEMTSRSRAREEALSISRQVIRYSANAIRAVHRGEFEEAQNLIHQAGERLEETQGHAPRKPPNILRRAFWRMPEKSIARPASPWR